jgi:starch phosphorylase
LLNIIETIGRYNTIRANPTIDFAPRVKIFAGKAAASYVQAKLIIKLAIDVARVVNSDPTVRGLLKVVFLPNYNVSLAETIIPAVDLSEQISTAGMEASGTGNMKMALNGALTVGTLDGANVEMKGLVGDDNIFIFGLTAPEVEASRALGIDSSARIADSPILREALDEIASGIFSADDRARYRGLVDSLTHHDYFMVCADFDAYWATQMKIDEVWRDRKKWLRSVPAPRLTWRARCSRPGGRKRKTSTRSPPLGRRILSPSSGRTSPTSAGRSALSSPRRSRCAPSRARALRSPNSGAARAISSKR